MAHTETMLESKEIFNGRVIRVTVDKVQLEDGTTLSALFPSHQQRTPGDRVRVRPDLAHVVVFANDPA